MATDYAHALENAKQIPQFCLGQEVDTKYGKGIIVGLEMRWNGLYIEPVTGHATVWFGTEKQTEFISGEFRLNEITATT